MKLNLPKVNSASSLSTINSNFDKITKELQENVLYRKNPSGEPNSLEEGLDANGKDIYNVGTLRVDTLIIDGVPAQLGNGGGGVGPAGPQGPQGPTGTAGDPSAYTLTAVSSYTAPHSHNYAPWTWLVRSDGVPVDTDFTYGTHEVSVFFHTPFTGTLYVQ